MTEEGTEYRFSSEKAAPVISVLNNSSILKSSKVFIFSFSCISANTFWAKNKHTNKTNIYLKKLIVED